MCKKGHAWADVEDFCLVGFSGVSDWRKGGWAKNARAWGRGEALAGIVRAERAGILLALAPDMKNLCE